MLPTLSPNGTSVLLSVFGPVLSALAAALVLMSSRFRVVARLSSAPGVPNGCMSRPAMTNAGISLGLIGSFMAGVLCGYILGGFWR